MKNHANKNQLILVQNRVNKYAFYPQKQRSKCSTLYFGRSISRKKQTILYHFQNYYLFRN